MEQTNHPGFELDEDHRQQKREWLIQRAAWIAFLLILAAVALGLLGRGGPLSDTRISASDGKLQLQYQRFLRNHSSDTIRLSIQPRAGKTRISFSNAYIEALEFTSITPPPDRTIAEDGVLTFEFNTRANVPAELHFHFEPQQIGSLRGTVAMDGDAPVTFTQFVYP
ncbi:hypothetical protein EDC30_11191 [Paucimonas lemoignei]|uniref:Transmembrane protein n=1 Tax=Paucimonas lemoignei TaxID=29443 RepID=A0A4R3HRF9_PAULE|nr:hypothetical protein [Paucimonas lemoignei]TCS35176.1 hypothetical protein EDC30_11191 [Paucimonas lemoignei]